MIRIEQLKDLYRKSFEDGESYLEYFFREKYDGKNAVTVVQGGKVVSALYLLDKTMRIGQNNTDCPFIAAAATLPELRGQGILGETMKKAFDTVRGGGSAVTALYPFRHDYYKRFGFVTYSFTEERRLDLTHAHDGYRASKCGAERLGEMAHIYQKYTSPYHGYLVRSGGEFRKRVEEYLVSDEIYALMSPEGEMRGYALVDLDGPEAVEFCCLDAETENAFLSAHGIPCHLPAARGTEYGMIRAVDIEKLLLLSEYRPGVRSIEFSVEDRFYGPNNISLRLEVSGGVPRVTRIGQANRTVSVEDATLAAMGNVPEGCPFFRDFFAEKINFIADKC